MYSQVYSAVADLLDRYREIVESFNHSTDSKLGLLNYFNEALLEIYTNATEYVLFNYATMPMHTNASSYDLLKMMWESISSKPHNLLYTNL